MEYPVVIDGQEGAYGAVFPDLPGCVAMGVTLDDAIRNAGESLQDWIDSMESGGQTVPDASRPEDVDVPSGSTLASVVLTRDSSARHGAKSN